MSSSATARSRWLLAAFVLLLVVVAFARAQWFSSTGIRIAGDGVHYEEMASSTSLEGRAPFVYRPAVPLLVGLLFGGNLIAGFALVCALALFASLYATAALARDELAGYLLAAVMFLNYQLFFGPANVARLDTVVFAAQMGFVALALRGNSRVFLYLMPFAALLKESMLLSLGALALVAFPRDTKSLARLATATVVFIAIHAGVRSIATPTSVHPPYTEQGVTLDGLLQMLSSNLSWMTPLNLVVAWGGLCLIVLVVAARGSASGASARTIDLVSAGAFAFLLLFPLALATDVQRAWFELLAPATMYLILVRTTDEDRGIIRPALGLALLASALPYATRFVGGEHLYLTLAEGRPTTIGLVVLVATLVLAAAAARTWRRLPGRS